MTDFPEIKQFLEHLQARKYAEKTVTGRCKALKRFSRWLEEQGFQRLQDVTTRDVEQYMARLVADELKQTTIEGYMTGVTSLFRYLEEHCLIFENPARDLKYWQTDTRLPQVITVEQVKTLLDVPDCSTPRGLRDRAMLETFYSTGMRREELTELCLGNLDLRDQTVMVFGKGQKQRVLPLGRHASHYLDQYIRNARPILLKGKDSDRLWIGETHRPLGEEGIGLIVRECARGAGIKSQVSCHTLRRSCATHLLQNGANPLMVAALLGHDDLSTLGRYLRVTIKDIREMHKRSLLGQ